MNDRTLSGSPTRRYLERLHRGLLEIRDGEVASYIPELAGVEPDLLGIALATVDGHIYGVGDADRPFTVQSISKAIVYGLALESQGLESVLARVGVEPSGDAFNSISLAPGSGRPLNPMINAGAIAATGLVLPGPDGDRLGTILRTFAAYTGRNHQLDDSIYRSERDTGHRNRAIAHLLYGYGMLDRGPEEILDLYFRQCAILVTARDLAMMGACLANAGVNPVTGGQALEPRYVDKVLSVMSTCGMYDYSGNWLFHVGMPAKSGVGGGIMAVLPGQLGLGVFSPRLDANGNSVRGIEACKRISSDFGLHLFHVARATSASVLRETSDCAHSHSNRMRTPEAFASLQERGSRILVYRLQGEPTLCSAESVVLDMLKGLADADCLVVDLGHTVSMDQAASQVFQSFCAQVADAGKRVFVTESSHLPGLRRLLAQPFGPAQDPHPLAFDRADQAVEWCEDRLLEGLGGGDRPG